MTISLSDTGKRYNRDWIFRHVNMDIMPGEQIAITGPNGSGKSTLLQCIAGAVMTSEGAIHYKDASGQKIAADKVYQQLSFCAPYLELIEEMTITELLHFHHSFKNWLPGWTVPQIVQYIGLQAAANKQIRYYSSGMKQRVKLAQAIFSDTPIVMLDEPCTNFDEAGFRLYNTMINEFCQNRTVMVSSNDVQEYGFCKKLYSILDYK